MLAPLLLWFLACRFWVSDADVCDDAVQRVRWYNDADGDGHGDPDASPRCAPADGLVDNADDCDDGDRNLGTVAEIGPVSGVTLWCRDADQDGVGRSDDCVETCRPPPGYEAPEAGDCDDDNPLFTVVCPWTQVAAEAQATCAVRADTTVACWGSDAARIVSEAPTDGGFVDVEVGHYSACGRSAAGEVTCWGMGADPAPEGLVVSTLAVGAGVYCALDPVGAITCWADDPGPWKQVITDAPAGEGYTSLGMDDGIACATDRDGKITCWGARNWAAVIDNVPKGGGYRQVSISQYYLIPSACALTAEGGVDCWGTDGATIGAPRGEGYVQVEVGGVRGWGLREDGTLEYWGQEIGPSLDGYEPLDDVVQIAAGEAHTCAVRQNGQLVCWGDNALRAATVPSPALDSLAAGGHTTCGTTATGTDLHCWGEPRPVPERRYEAVSTNGVIRCAVLRGGRIDCWTLSGGSLDVMPMGVGYQGVTVGYKVNCAINAEGAFECWDEAGRPIAAPRGTGWSDYDRGYDYVCALDGDGVVVCWGEADWLDEVPTDAGFIDLSAGGGHTCAIDAAGFITCWGAYVNAVTVDWGDPYPPPEEGGFVQVSCGFTMNCAVRPDGTPVCWDSEGAVATPASAVNLAVVEVGAYHTACGLTYDGAVICWASDSILARERPRTDGWVSLEVDDSSHVNACVLNDAGTLACWGDYAFPREANHGLAGPSLGQQHGCAMWRDEVRCFGSDSHGQSSAPLDPFVSVAAGGNHSCALDADGDVTCWGANTAGQTRVPSGLDAVASLALGGEHTCALLRDGTLTCWGAIDAPPGGTWTGVSSGRGHACALDAAGGVACWGANGQGQASVPADLPPAVQVVAGGYHTCALGEDGFPTCWGLDTSHQDADPRVRFTTLAAGAEHTCGIRLDGLPWCWGRDLEGQGTPPSPEVLVGE